jgi:hypothetical protein
MLLVRLDVGDDAIGHVRGCFAVKDESVDSWRPTGAVPLEFDGDEDIAGKQRHGARDLTAAADHTLADPRQVDLVAIEREETDRDALALRLSPP